MRLLIVLLLVCWVLPAPDPARAENRVETEHLYVEWVDGTPPQLIEVAQAEGERFFAAVAEFLGQAPDHRIIVMLRGPSEQPDGSRKAPHVDAFGRIQLFSFDPSGYSYFAALAHEMVHAFRFQRRATADWFFEEGLAEMVALRVDDSLAGFPWFEFPVVVVAGQWLASGEDIPLAELRDRHDDLNQACRAQSYGLRSAFFDHLGRTYGDETVVAMASRENAGALDDYARFFGADFDALAAAWREELRAAYDAVPDAAAQARRYRTESPVQYIPVCKRGVDF